MTWWNPFSWGRGSPYLATPKEGPGALQAGHGILAWLRSIGKAWTGVADAPRSAAYPELASDRVKANLGALGGRYWFLPYQESLTGETAAMRIAYRQMLREPFVKAALYGLEMSVAQLDLEVHPNGEGKRASERAAFIEHLLANVEGGTQAMIEAILIGALIDGYSVCEKVWAIEDRGQFKGKLILKRLRPIDPDLLRIEIDQFRNITGYIGLQYNAGERFDAGLFVTTQYLPLFHNPGGMSALRAAYRAYVIKDTAWKLRAIHLEKYTSPMLKGVYQTADQKPIIETAMTNARASTWISLPEGVQVEAMDIAVQGTRDFESAIKDLNQEIQTCITHAVMQASGGEGKGSYALAKIHKGTAEIPVWHLASLACSSINGQIVPDAISLNYADDEEYPTVTSGGINDEELIPSLQIDKFLHTDAGLPLSRKELYARYNRSEPTDKDDNLAPPPAPGGPGGPGGGGMGGGGGLPFADQTVLDAVPAKPLDQGGKDAAARDGLTVSHDGQRAARLMAEAKDEGIRVLAELAESAVKRLVRSPTPLLARKLFNEHEEAKLAELLASTTGTAHLLGASRIALRAHKAQRQGPKYDAFGETDAWHESFAEGDHLQLMSPEEAVDYFKGLIPTLDVDPRAYGLATRREAFTLAGITEQTLLERVQDLLANALEQGQGIPRTTRELRDLLTDAGVTHANPQRSEMIVRTNLRDAYMEGQQEQIQDHHETFPAWRYEGIDDGRQGKDHEPHFGNFYPIEIPFSVVRGPRVYNCRCDSTPCDKYTWDELQQQGTRFAVDYPGARQVFSELRRFAAEDWTHSLGKMGGSVWTNKKTGKKVYSKENPGGKEEEKQKALEQKQKEKAAQDAVKQKQKAELEQKKQEKAKGQAAAVTQKQTAAQEQQKAIGEAHAKVDAHLANPETITPEALAGLQEQLAKLPLKEIKAIRDKIGAKGGVKAEQVIAKIKATLAGKAVVPPPAPVKPPEQAKPPEPAPPPPPPPKPAEVKPEAKPETKPEPSPAGERAQREAAEKAALDAHPEVAAYRRQSEDVQKIFGADRPPLVISRGGDKKTNGDKVADLIGEAAYSNLLMAAQTGEPEGTLTSKELKGIIGEEALGKLAASQKVAPDKLTLKNKSLAAALAGRNQFTFKAPRNQAELVDIEPQLEAMTQQEREQVAKYMGMPPHLAATPQRLADGIGYKMFNNKKWIDNPLHPAEQIHQDKTAGDIHQAILEHGQKVKQAERRQNEITTRLKAISRSLPALGPQPANREELLKEGEALLKEGNELKETLSTQAKQAHEIIRKSIQGVHGGNAATVKYGGQVDESQARVTPAMRGQLDEAEKFYDGMIAAGPESERLAKVNLTIDPDPDYRAGYLSTLHRVEAGENTSSRVHIHELGHALEEVPGVSKAARDFLAYRTQGEPEVDIGTLPGGQRMAGEMGKIDQFGRSFGSPVYAAYVGKTYATGQTEIVSMGIEQVYNDPIYFAQKDPEYFKFIMGVMAGTGRRK